MFVKPAEGLKVRRPPPSSQFLPAGGAEVNLHEAGMYWARRLRDGDVVEVEPPSVQPAAPAPAAPAPAETAQQVAADHVAAAEAEIQADTEKLATAEAAATEAKGAAQ